jgi:hypothetical protein
MSDAEQAIYWHNHSCQNLCGRGELEAVRCGYRAYFAATGRRCTDCPTDWKIEYPRGSGQFPESTADTSTGGV